MTIKYFQTELTGQWYFRVVARNGRIIAQSEGYPEERNCVKAINALKQGAAQATVKKVGGMTSVLQDLPRPKRTIKSSPKEGSIPRERVAEIVRKTKYERDHG